MSYRARILAVDDNEDTLEVIRLALQDDFDVMTVSNAMEVYELIELFEPDLLVLDVMMPRITGFQLVEMLQRNPVTKALPVIILSAKNSQGEIRHGYKLGASLYLTKPFEPQRLLKNVRAQLDTHPPQDTEKTHTLPQCQLQLKMKQTYQEGHAKLASTRLEDDELLNEKKLENLRKRFQDKNRAKPETSEQAPKIPPGQS